MSTAVVAASGSRAPRCGCASSAKSGATLPKSANTAGHASHVPWPSISSSAAHPVRPSADIARPSAIVAQKSHWQPRHVWRRADDDAGADQRRNEQGDGPEPAEDLRLIAQHPPGDAVRARVQDAEE